MNGGHTQRVANLTLATGIEKSDPAKLAPGFSIRPSTDADGEKIGSLYFESYEVGQACATEAEAIADVAGSFAGECGEYLHFASPVVVEGDNLVAAIMTVRRAPWDGTPDCPFIIELFTHPDYRQRGLGAALIQTATAALAATATCVALRVDEQNTPALALYRKLGFTLWEAPACH